MSVPDPSTSFHKPHRKPQAGRSFDKKHSRDLTRKQATTAKKNPHAFSVQSTVRAARSQRRNLDLATRRQHLPIHSHVTADATTTTTTTAAAAAAAAASTVDPPPFLVTVIGPKGTGKSSIIMSLVKHYTGHSIPLAHLRGPITLLTASNRRITLIEAQPTLSSIIDLSKAADLVLLTVDASFGFEMETFETLNALKQHGLPKVMGVLTHLDQFHTNKQINTVKRKMKHRFWTEICDGAKLFYLSGIINGKYLKREVSNLARFISVMKYRPLEFRSTHPYVLCDRMEDLTAPGSIERNALCDRRVAVYGYVRGTMLHPRQQLHVMGVGDYVAASFQLLDDPCACKRRKEAAGGGRRRKLNEKEKRMYAPMSDVGEVMYDEDAMYIDMKAKHVHYTTEDKLVRLGGEETAAERDERERKERERSGGMASMNDESVAMVRAMQGVREAVDEKLRGSEIQLFKSSEMMTEEAVQEAEHEDGEDQEEEEEDEEMARLRAEEAKEAVQERMSSRVVMHKGRVRRKVVWDDDADEADTLTANGGDDAKDSVEDDEAVDGEIEGVDDEGEEGGEDEYYQNNFEETRQRLRAAGVNQLTINGHKYSGVQIEEQKEADVEDEAPSDDEMEERDEEAIDSDEGEQDNDEVQEDEDEVDGTNGVADASLSSLTLDEQKQQSADDRHISTAWKDDIIRRATATHQRTTNLMQLVYGTSTNNTNSNQSVHHNHKHNKSTNKLQLFADDDDTANHDSPAAATAGDHSGEDDGDELFSTSRRDDGEHATDSVVLSLRVDEEKQGEKSEWTEDDEFESIRNRFVTGDWSEEVKGVEDDDDGKRDSEEEEEDKRRKRKERKGRRGRHEADTAAAHTTDTANSSNGEDEADHGISVEDDTATAANETDEQAAERRRLAKEQQKASFNATYDKPNPATTTSAADSSTAEDKDDTTHLDTLTRQAAAQAVLDSSAFGGLDEHSRVLLEGARPGQYIRIELTNVPCEFVTNFSPANPLVVGGLLPHESGVGWLQCRVKRHRWHKRILKSNDMLIVSNGWRRYQTLPVYAMEDRSGRLRYLKYTPEHMHCTAVMYGPLAAVNSGFLAYQYEGGNISSFRIALTGTITAQSKGKEKDYAILKKLKLIGHPYKIFKHTAFIKDMFTSSTEVARFMNASVRTVSGIRGAIKAAITTGGHDGMFRATFEDRIVASDIVVCRSWSTVDVHAFYAPVQNLLVKGVWRGLRTIREVREAEGKWAEQRADSMYGRAIERRDKKFSALHVSKTLAKQLPFAAKEKVMPARAANRPLYEEARLVVRSKEEKELYTFMQHVNTVKGVRDEKRKEARGRQREKYLKKKQAEENKHAAQNKLVRKRRYEAEGQGRVVKQRKYSDK